jgi:hypothetical protein
VVGLELRNPLGSKSAPVAAASSGDLAETARRRPFTFELRCFVVRGVAWMEQVGWQRVHYLTESRNRFGV